MPAIPVFLSVPRSFMSEQEAFLKTVERELEVEGLAPRTLGRTEYDMDAPLEGIRRLMVDCCGLLTLAFRRTYIETGTDKPASNLGETETSLNGTWLTSPYCHIEPAMAFQLGVPLLIWRERGVRTDGVLDRGAIGMGMPEFDLAAAPPSLSDTAWRGPFRQWLGRVETVHRNRGAPVRLWEK